jgi:hypothetical protein
MEQDKKQAEEKLNEGMEKRNVIEPVRTPAEEEKQADDTLTKQATDLFDSKKKDVK